MNAVTTADIGLPNRMQAAKRLIDAQVILADHKEGRKTRSHFTILMAEAHLFGLQTYPKSEAIRKHARKACLRFGIVAQGFTVTGKEPA